MSDNTSPNEVIEAVNAEAAKRGRTTTKGGRSELRRELSKELADIADNESREQEAYGDVEDAACAFLDYAEKIDAFKVKSKVGVAVVQTTVRSLRDEYAKTGTCQVWPFC